MLIASGRDLRTEHSCNLQAAARGGRLRRRCGHPDRRSDHPGTKGHTHLSPLSKKGKKVSVPFFECGTIALARRETERHFTSLQTMTRPVRAAAAPSSQSARGTRPRHDKYFSKVIGKALDLIAILRASPQPLSLNELTLRLELAKSSVFRILHTLEVSGYIERDVAGRYTLAADLRAWAPGQLRVALVEVAMPALKELSREFGETVSLAMRFENRVEVIGTIESPHLIRMGNTVGRIVPPHASSLGKAVVGVSIRRGSRSVGAQLRHSSFHRAHRDRRSRAQARIRARAIAWLQHGRGRKRPRWLLLRRADPRRPRRRGCRPQHLGAENAASATSSCANGCSLSCAASPIVSPRSCCPARHAAE